MLEQPDVRAKLAGVQMLPAASTPAALGAPLKAEVAKWTQVAQGAGIKSE